MESVSVFELFSSNSSVLIISLIFSGREVNDCDLKCNRLNYRWVTLLIVNVTDSGLS